MRYCKYNLRRIFSPLPHHFPLAIFPFLGHYICIVKWQKGDRNHESSIFCFKHSVAGRKRCGIHHGNSRGNQEETFRRQITGLRQSIRVAFNRSPFCLPGKICSRPRFPGSLCTRSRDLQSPHLPQSKVLRRILAVPLRLRNLFSFRAHQNQRFPLFLRFPKRPFRKTPARSFG